MVEYNANDPRQVRRAKQLAEQQQNEWDVAVAELMRTPAGRSYIHNLLAMECHVYQTSFNSSALALAFNEGQRSVGLRLLADIGRAAPDQYTQMMREVNDREHADRRGGDRQITNGRDQPTDSATGSVEWDYNPSDADRDAEDTTE